MSLFLLWDPLFMTGNGPKTIHSRPKMAKHGRPVNVPKWSKKVPNDGSKVLFYSKVLYWIGWGPKVKNGPIHLNTTSFIHFNARKIGFEL